jgi:hypothetical protein
MSTGAQSLNATFVSVWDGGTEIRSNCHYDPTTNTVSNIEDVDVDGIEVLDKEYVEYGGRTITAFTMEDGRLVRGADDEGNFLICYFDGTHRLWEVVSGEDAMQERAHDLSAAYGNLNGGENMPLVFRMEHEIDNEKASDD